MDACSFFLRGSAAFCCAWLREEVVRRKPPHVNLIHGGLLAYVDYKLPWRERMPPPIGGVALFVDAWVRANNDLGLQSLPRSIELTLLPSSEEATEVEAVCNYDYVTGY